MTIRIAGFTCLVALSFFSISAQYNKPKEQDFQAQPSWETYEFMKYGKVGVTLYTGTVNYTIPIYSYQDNDFDYSISVDYATNGYRVNHSSGLLSDGWSLSKPGVITQEIRGVLDSSSSSKAGDNGVEAILDGFKFIPEGLLERMVITDPSDNRAYTCYRHIGGKKQWYYDAEPDIFTFNFLGYKGSFHRLRTTNSKERFLIYDVDTSSKGLKVKKLDERSIGEIVLVDTKGYEYTFKGGEYTIGYLDDYNYADYYDDYKNRKLTKSWFLTNVKAPNGRMICFDYEQDKVNEEKELYSPQLRFIISHIPGYTAIPDVDRECKPGVTRMKQSRLTKVKFPDETIMSISYEPGVKDKRYQGYGSISSIKESPNINHRVKRIEVMNGEKPLRQADFSYSQLEHAYDCVQVLQSITISGNGRFSFGYYPMTAIPALGTLAFDHWGFFNGTGNGFDSTCISDNFSYDENYDETISSQARKNPSFKDAVSGCLRTIHYPTGGYSLLSYEPHDCSQKVARTSGSEFVPRLQKLDKDEVVGGLRIKEIVTYTEESEPCDTVRYEYKDINGISSGILLNTPRYGIEYKARGWNSTMEKDVVYLNLSNNMWDYGRPHIEYADVKEDHGREGYIKYHYTNYFEYPDDVDLEEEMMRRISFNNFWTRGDDVIFSFRFYADEKVNNILRPFPSAQTKRGLLSKKTYFSPSGQKRKELAYKYDFPLVAIDSIMTIVGEEAMEILYPRYNVELARRTEKSFLRNSTVRKSESFEYDTYGNIMLKKTSTSDRVPIVERYYYVGNCGVVSDDFNTMLKYNLTSYLTKYELYAYEDYLSELQQRTEHVYRKPDYSKESLWRQKEIRDWDGDSMVLASKYEYDRYGNISQIEDADGNIVSYIWSYKGRYPVLKARNVSAIDLNTALTHESVRELHNMPAVSDATFAMMEKVLRRLPKAHIDLFKFEPSIGMKESVLSNSLRTYYIYDGYGRLSETQDGVKNILRKRTYNLRTMEP